MDRAAFEEQCRLLGLTLSADQLDSFGRFEVALYKANEVMNLTRVPPEECWIRHFLDSLLFQDLIARGSRVLDIGTGPGFPAWPLALARPDLEVTALDSSGKMLGFLRSQILPNLEVVQERAEEWGVKEKFDVVTGRALAPLAIQLELSAPPCRVGGAVIPMRTASDEGSFELSSLQALGLRLKDVVRRTLPVVDAPRVFPVYEKVSPTRAVYPRKWADIKSKPLK